MFNVNLRKLVITAVGFLVLTSLIACSTDGDNGEDNGQVTLTVWSTSDQLELFVAGFEAQNPDITVDLQVLPNDGYLTRLLTTLNSGQNAPDVFTAESDYVRRLVNTTFMADLSEAPFNFDNEEAGLWEYVVDIGTDLNGVIRALSWQASPGGIIYRTDLAERYLGVSSPEEMSALLTSTQGMLEVAARLRENDIVMFASWEDLFNMEFSNRESGWVVDNTLVIDENMEIFMETARTIVTNGYSLNVSPWDAEWIAAVNADNVFSYVLPTWGYQFVVRANADATIGDWGLAETPHPYVRGGTWLGIYAESENQEAAWRFMEYVTINQEAQIAFSEETGEYMSVRAVGEFFAAGEGEEVLGGQNAQAFYNHQMSKGIPALMTAYDGPINDAFLAATRLYVQGTMTREEALESFRLDVRTAFPDLVVE